MSMDETTGPGPKALAGIRRKGISLSGESFIQTKNLLPGRRLPLLVQPAVGEVSLAGWAAANRDFIQEKTAEHGALLFRNFHTHEVSLFEQFVEAVSGELMEYRERSSPRSQVSERVYTSTDHPPDQSIFVHNEHSYSKTFPLKLYFCCLVRAERGGETPLADTRKIFQRISPAVRQRFIEKKWMYVRNFNDGFGLSWQTAYQTTDKSIVEEYCRRAGVECEWKKGDRLRTRQVRPAVARHPRTGEMVWFNHATFFHVSTLEPSVRDALLAEFKEEDLPNNSYYGDGTPIEPWVMDELRQAYVAEMVSFPWQEGDIVLLDNMATSHGRAPYEGARKVLFAMAEPFTRTDI
jgi:alpha-ketoglutarate-dependent taurine dioxygenase